MKSLNVAIMAFHFCALLGCSFALDDLLIISALLGFANGKEKAKLFWEEASFYKKQGAE